MKIKLFIILVNNVSILKMLPEQWQKKRKMQLVKTGTELGKFPYSVFNQNQTEILQTHLSFYNVRICSRPKVTWFSITAIHNFIKKPYFVYNNNNNIGKKLFIVIKKKKKLPE